MRLEALSAGSLTPFSPAESAPPSSNAARRPEAAPYGDLGGAQFTTGPGLVEACRVARERRWLVAVPAELSAARGDVRRIVDEAVEGALAARGAVPPQVALDATPRETTRDQLFRVRALGAGGLLVCFPPLRHAIDEEGVLVGADAEVVTSWLRLAAHHEVQILLHEGDRGLSIVAPRPLEGVVAEVRPHLDDEVVAVAPIVVGPASAERATRWEDGADVTDELARPLESTFPEPLASSPAADAIGEIPELEVPSVALAVPDFPDLPELPPLEASPLPAPAEEAAPPVVGALETSSPGDEVLAAAATDDATGRAGDLGSARPAGQPATEEEAARSSHASVDDAAFVPEEGVEASATCEGDEAEGDGVEASATCEGDEAEGDGAEGDEAEGDDVEAGETDHDEGEREAIESSDSAASDGEITSFGLASVLDGVDDDQDVAIPLVAPAKHASASRAPIGRVAPRRPEPARRAEPRALHHAPAQRAETVVNSAEWRALAVELDAARGPKPVRVIEKLFRTRYLPLVGAIQRGEVDGAVAAVAHAWRDSFAESYVDGFSALRVTGKRPPMVLDAPEIATRMARLNGARSVKLLLVDSMSFDIAERLSSRMRERLNGRAVCVEKTMLWSALPTSTPTQMALLSRGPEGLRDPSPESVGEPDVTRGRAVSTLRRVRIGHRELMKLDLLEARLRSAGPGYDERMESLAEEVYTIVDRFIATLPPRTLLFVFGDHGFRLPEGMGRFATGPAEQGGATPEEVLVSAHAWLTGGVH